MRLYSLISIMHAQFGTPTSIKKSRQSYKLFKINAYVSVFNQIIKPIFGDKCPLYMKDVFDKSCISQASTRNSTMKLSQPLRRTNLGQHCISFSAPSVWNNLPNELKHCTNLNTFKNKIKEYLLYKIRQKDNDIYHYDYSCLHNNCGIAFFL